MTVPGILCIGGAPSSGTTLLADLMDAVPGVACTPELNIFCIGEAYTFNDAFKNRARKRKPFTIKSPYVSHSKFFNTKHLAACGLTEAELDAAIANASTINEFVGTLADKYVVHRARPISIFAEKTPLNVLCAQQFCTAFPNGLFVHVVRDPRAVVASLMSRGYHVLEAALIWHHQTRAGCRAMEGATNVMHTRYEDILQQPFKSAAMIAARLGVSAEPSEIAHRFRANSYRSALPRVESWSHKSYTGDISPPTPYQQRLSPEQIRLIESLTWFTFNLDGNLHYRGSVQTLMNLYGYTHDPIAANVRLPFAAIAEAYSDWLLNGRCVKMQRGTIPVVARRGCKLLPLPWTAIWKWLPMHYRRDWRWLPRNLRHAGFAAMPQIALLTSLDSQLASEQRAS